MILTAKEIKLKHKAEQQKDFKPRELVSCPDKNELSNPDKFDEDAKDKSLTANEVNSLLEKDLEKYSKPFPIDSFPELIQRYSKDLEITLNFPIEYTCAGIMVCAAGAIGKKFRAVFKGGFEVVPNLYVALVGKAGTNKTSPLEKALKPLLDKEQIYWEEYLKNAAEQDHRQENLPKIKRQRCLAQDVTMEALLDILQNNSITLYNDELMSFLNSMNKYRKGDDMQKYLSIWSAAQTGSDRTQVARIVKKPILNCVGSIQTDVLLKFIVENNSNNGFLERFLFVNVQKQVSQRWNDLEANAHLQEEYNNMINSIIDSKTAATESGETIPRTLNFSEAAQVYLIKWQNQNAKICEESSSDQLQRLYSKFQIYVLRFSMILAILDYACKKKPLLQSKTAKLEITEKHAVDAIKLIAYFQDSAKKIFSLVPESVHLKKLNRKLVNFFEKLPKEFSTRKALQVGRDLEISERNVYYYLKSDYFKQLKQGYYQKKYQEI